MYRGADYTPSVCNIGYMGENYNRKTDKLLYARWNNMLQRCYNPKMPNYKNYGALGVTVSEEWHNFSNYKKWFYDNFWDIGSDEKVVVDKDILIPNNKIYSSNTCLLIPVSFNSIFAGIVNEYNNKSKKTSTGYSGVIQNDDGTYKLEIFKTSFSNFKTLENAYKTKSNMFKALINGMVNNYPNMPQKVKDAILNYPF